MRIWEQRKNFRAESSFQTYLFSVAKNVLSEEERYFRKTNSRRLSIDSSTSSEPTDSEANAHHLDITSLLSDLPHRSAQAIKLFYFKNLSTSKAAKIAGCSHEAFRKRLYRAKNQLRDALISLEHPD